MTRFGIAAVFFALWPLAGLTQQATDSAAVEGAESAPVASAQVTVSNENDAPSSTSAQMVQQTSRNTDPSETQECMLAVADVAPEAPLQVDDTTATDATPDGVPPAEETTVAATDAPEMTAAAQEPATGDEAADAAEEAAATMTAGTAEPTAEDNAAEAVDMADAGDTLEDPAPGDQAQEPAQDEATSPASNEAAAATAPEETPAATEPEVAAAPDPEPEPAVAPEIAQCLEIAGPADAGVPANSDDAAARRDALIKSAEVCARAAERDDAPGDVLFHAAKIAEARRDAGRAHELLERAASLGLGAAETRIGDYYLFGILPGGQNPTEAIKHYQLAADLGDPAGMTSLALLQRAGTGLPADPAKMVRLLKQAADAGYHFAQYSLGQVYLNGEGIPGRSDEGLGIPDPARGAAYLTDAAEAGNITAALELAKAYRDPATGLEDDPEARAQLTSLAARNGLPAAIAAMGVLYEEGDGVEYNPQIAAGLYVRALETGEVAFDSLRNGARGGWDRDTAVAFQLILQDRGLYQGVIDGIVGRGTAGAARALASE